MVRVKKLNAGGVVIQLDNDGAQLMAELLEHACIGASRDTDNMVSGRYLAQVEFRDRLRNGLKAPLVTEGSKL